MKRLWLGVAALLLAVAPAAGQELRGHGGPVRDFEELFNRYLRAIRERQAQVIRLVAKSGATAWDVAREMFPKADDVHRFLAVSEAVAHLDLAHAEGKIGVELSGAKEVYLKISAN